MATINKKNRPTIDQLTERNIETIGIMEEAYHAKQTWTDTLADRIAAFCGSMTFVWVHCVVFGLWLVVNTFSVFPKSVRIDPPPFSNLTLLVSLEAIFLSAFILISQNRQQALADRRHQLDLQINLLSEQENSGMLELLMKISNHLGIEQSHSGYDWMAKPTDTQQLMEKIDAAAEKSGTGMPNAE